MAVIMKLASSFTVPAAADKVVALFLDPTTMQACIPGCDELVQTDEKHYQGRLVNEVAHVRFKAGFKAEITSVSMPANPGDPSVVKAVLRGEDRRLGSTIRMDATLTVSPLDATKANGGGDSSEVAYEFELAIRGKLGRLGESVIRRRTAEVERQFAEALAAVCAGRPVPQRGKPNSAESGRGKTESAPEGRRGVAVTAETPIAEIPTAAAPTGQSSRDWLVLGLTAAGAFAYGILLGQRLGGRR
jgi:carbon monoxide dehydrogenase subunit G